MTTANNLSASPPKYGLNDLEDIYDDELLLFIQAIPSDMVHHNEIDLCQDTPNAMVQPAE